MMASLSVIYPGNLNIPKALLEELLQVIGLPFLGEPQMEHMISARLQVCPSQIHVGYVLYPHKVNL